MRERDYYWDNIKAVLIFTVVTGHFLAMSTLGTKLSVAMDNFIYSFHMPAFIFVSGFFAKRYCTDGKVRAVKAATLFAYYAVFQLLFIAVRLIFGIKLESIDFFNPGRGLWYLLVMFFLYLLVPVVEKLPAWLVLPISVIFALLAANYEHADTYLSLLRFFTFAPYFFLGYYISGDAIKKLRGIKLYIRLPLGLVCAASSVSLWFFDLGHAWRKLFYGKVNNIALKTDFTEASLLRLRVYLIALLMIAALLLIIPDKKSVAAKVGQNSLQIFVIHMLLVIVLFDSGLVKINIDNELVLALGILGSLALTAILSLGIFTYPFKWIQMGVNKLYSLKSK